MMLKLGEKCYKETKETFYAAKKKPIKIWDDNVDNNFISKLVKTQSNSKYLIKYLDKAIRPLVLIMPKRIGYVNILKVEDKNNKLVFFRINDEKLLEKYKAIGTKIED